MVNKNIAFCLILNSFFLCEPAFAIIYAGRGAPPAVQEKSADFLQSIGVIAHAKKADYPEGSDLIVSFTSAEVKNYDDIFVELLLIDKSNNILLTVETPFVNRDHKVSYIIPKGYTLLVSIAMPISKDAEYFKVSFRNK